MDPPARHSDDVIADDGQNQEPAKIERSAGSTEIESGIQDDPSQCSTTKKVTTGRRCHKERRHEKFFGEENKYTEDDPRMVVHEILKRFEHVLWISCMFWNL